MGPHRLQRIARRRLQMAVIYNEGATLLAGNPPAEFPGDLQPLRGKFNDIAIGTLGIIQCGGHEPHAFIANAALQPFAMALLELPDGNGIEEFIGHQQQGAIGKACDGLMPGRLAAELVLLSCRRTGLISTRWRRAASTKPGMTFPALRMSAIRVPRPGPSSTRLNGAGLPSTSHAATSHTPISSPKICEISGAVMKSPCSPKGSRVM